MFAKKFFLENNDAKDDKIIILYKYYNRLNLKS